MQTSPVCRELSFANLGQPPHSLRLCPEAHNFTGQDLLENRSVTLCVTGLIYCFNNLFGRVCTKQIFSYHREVNQIIIKIMKAIVAHNVGGGDFVPEHIQALLTKIKYHILILVERENVCGL